MDTDTPSIARAMLDCLTQALALTRAQQAVFTYCLGHRCAVVRQYTPMVRHIADAIGVTPRTVQRALRAIQAQPILARCVAYVRIDPRQEIAHDRQARP